MYRDWWEPSWSGCTTEAVVDEHLFLKTEKLDSLLGPPDTLLYMYGKIKYFFLIKYINEMLFSFYFPALFSIPIPIR